MAYTLYDSFEDGDHSHFSTSAGILSEGTSANAIDGSNTLSVLNLPNYGNKYEFAVDTTAGIYPGNRIRYYQASRNSAYRECGLMYGSPSLGSGYVVAYKGNGFRLSRFDGGTYTAILGSTSIESFGGAYVEVDFASDGTHAIKLYDDSTYTSPVYEIGATDTTYNSGGIGFTGFNDFASGSYEIDKIEYESLGGGVSSPPAAPSGLTLTQL